jgi:hypothetical protein
MGASVANVSREASSALVSEFSLTVLNISSSDVACKDRQSHRVQNRLRRSEMLGTVATVSLVEVFTRSCGAGPTALSSLVAYILARQKPNEIKA